MQKVTGTTHNDYECDKKIGSQDYAKPKSKSKNKLLIFIFI